MPELPEVEAQRSTIEAATLGRRIATLIAVEQGGGPRDGQFDDKVIAEEVTPDVLAITLQDRWVLGVRRRGKQLWLELGESKGGACCACLLIHMGMTGAVIVQGVAAPVYKSFAVDETAWPPRFTKLELLMADAAGVSAPCVRLAFTDPRRFGRVLLRGADPFSRPPLSALAADPVTDPPSAEAFASVLRRVRAPIKAALLDQGRVVCGVGNWVADEVLYQAGVLPAAPCESLSEEQLAAIHAQVLAVCTAACGRLERGCDFPVGWLFHHRWQARKPGPHPPPDRP